MADVQTVTRAHCRLCGYVWEPGAEDLTDASRHTRCPACHDGAGGSWVHKRSVPERTEALGELQKRESVLRAEILMRRTELLMVRHRIDQLRAGQEGKRG